MIDFKQITERHFDYAVNMRRYFHENREISNHEKNTSLTVKNELDKLGIQNYRFDDYTVIGIIKTGRPGKKIGIRGDMDALPITEETDVPFRSKNDGAMHACGHDSHTANLLALARCILDAKDELCGEYWLLFQTAEETFHGGIRLLKHVRELGGVDHVIAMHQWASNELGTVIIGTGRILAGVISYKITVVGKSGHGSTPHTSKDPLKPAREILLRLSSVPVNMIDAQNTTVFSTCSIHGGTAINIVPDEAYLLGTVRYTDKGITDDIIHYLESISDGITKSYGCSYRLEFMNEHIYPVVNNDKVAEIARNQARQINGVNNVITKYQSLGSDDIALLLDEYPGCYMFIGATSPEKGIPVCASHNSKFNIDEDYMKIACELLFRTAVELQK